jgi:hypothetical protein
MKQPNISRYLLSLSHLCREVSDKPALVPTFLRIVALVPQTIVDLQRADDRRMAA